MTPGYGAVHPSELESFSTFRAADSTRARAFAAVRPVARRPAAACELATRAPLRGEPAGSTHAAATGPRVLVSHAQVRDRQPGHDSRSQHALDPQNCFLQVLVTAELALVRRENRRDDLVPATVPQPRPRTPRGPGRCPSPPCPRNPGSTANGSVQPDCCTESAPIGTPCKSEQVAPGDRSLPSAPR